MKLEPGTHFGLYAVERVLSGVPQGRRLGVRHLASSVFEVYHSALNRLLNNPLHALRGLKGAAVVFCRNGQGGSLS